VIYRRRPTPLHAARASASGLWCLALAAAAVALEHPVVLGALLLAVVAAGAAAQVPREVGRALRWGVPFALAIALINALVVREGLTVIVRGGTVPVLGALDVTLEATLYGAVLGLRALVLLGAFALYSAAVDPDEVLRGLRRLSHRSALTATLTTRMVPVLARDARRLSDAQRARGVPVARAAVLRAVVAGALERAVDVAATLEVRGYAAAVAPPRRVRPWSRHDLAFLLAGVALLALTAGAMAGGWAAFSPYPAWSAPVRPQVLALAAALLACALAPLADRRGVAG